MLYYFYINKYKFFKLPIMAKRKWKRFNGEVLTDAAMDFMRLGKTDEWSNWDFGWTDAYYQGDDPETATQWFITCDDGGFYKVGAQYMTWFRATWRVGKKDINEVIAKCNWTTSALNRTLKALRHDEEPPRDPNYQT